MFYGNATASDPMLLLAYRRGDDDAWLLEAELSRECNRAPVSEAERDVPEHDGLGWDRFSAEED